MQMDNSVRLWTSQLLLHAFYFNSTYNISISMNMIVKIQVTKLLTYNFSTFSLAADIS